MNFNKTLVLVALGLMVTTHSNGLELLCEQSIKDAQTVEIPARNYARFELSEDLQCSWSSIDKESTGSVLFEAPEITTPTEIEIATRLDIENSTATHVALLNSEYEPAKWIPFTEFRERKGYLTTRFFLNPSDQIRYILVGGAHNSSEQTLSRTYSPVSTDLLNIAGLVTAREVSSEFMFVPTGKIRVRIRKPRNDRVAVTG